MFELHNTKYHHIIYLLHMDARTFRYSKNRYLSIHILLTCCYTCTALRITLKVYLCIQIPSLLHLLYCNTNANKSVFMYSIPPKISQVKLKKKRISTKLRHANYIFATIPKDLIFRFFTNTFIHIMNLQMTWGESSSSTLEGHLICFLQQIFHEKLKCSRDYYWNGGSNFANIFICLHNFLDSSLEKR